MPKILLFNTLTRRKEEFRPTIDKQAGLYTCGPTVYNYAHIGNLRTYIFEDILVRVLAYNGYRVERVMNITDVGHLTGDRDMGEDKLEKEAQAEHKSAWDIAAFYTDAFKRDMERLNLKMPNRWCRATDEIEAQIDLIKTLETKGYTYKTSDGIYFDTAKFKDYNKLSHQNIEALREGARVEKNDEKRNPTDFALWKFSPQGGKRQMEWESPWGTGFPGWHIECSAMSMKYLDGRQDIHCGGADHIDVHHTNEIAQSEAATGKKFFNIWMHGAFLNIAGGKKMAKSEGNFLTLENAFVRKGIDPLVYRYAALHTHYRKPMEYSEEVMANAARGYEHLKNQVRELGQMPNDELRMTNNEFKEKFLGAVNDDLNMPQAMAVVQEMLKSDLPNGDKMSLIRDFDKVLGLNLGAVGAIQELPPALADLAKQREQARLDKDFGESDRLRGEIQKLGYEVEDTADGTRVFKIQ